MNKVIFTTSLSFLAATALFAQQPNGAPSLHVFGGWAYAKTDGNTYLDGTRGGQFDNAYVALNVAAVPAERLRLESQAAFEMDRGVRHIDLDYGFAEWRFSDALRLHAGRMKHPFGIYSEIYDVGTLRPFYTLSQSVYGASGTTVESYEGAGISGFRKLGDGWGVTYDAYRGDLRLPFADRDGQHGAIVADGELNVKRAYGGRAVFETPVDGLSVGTAAYRGTISGRGPRASQSAADAQVDYAKDRLSLRGEWVLSRNGPAGEHGAYGDAAWTFTRHWQGAVRFDGLHERGDGTDDGRHNEVALGVNYWLTRHFVFKLSGHRAHGTHFVLPDAATGALEARTHLLLFGAQFSY
jgi:hypothetical protein